MPAHRKDNYADEMFALYQSGFSLSQVGKSFGVTRQSVYKVFARRRFELRKIKALPFIVFNGFKYTVRTNGYFAKTKSGRSYLHRDVWMFNNGPIPKGYDVHHINGNKEDNRIINLDLIAINEHGKLHSKTNSGFISTQFKKGCTGKYHPRRN